MASRLDQKLAIGGAPAIDDLLAQVNKLANADFDSDGGHFQLSAMDDKDVEMQIAQWEAGFATGNGSAQNGPGANSFAAAGRGHDDSDALFAALEAQVGQSNVPGVGSASVSGVTLGRSNNNATSSSPDGEPPARRARLDGPGQGQQGQAVPQMQPAASPEAQQLAASLQNLITTARFKAQEAQASGQTARARIFLTLAQDYSTAASSLANGAPVAAVSQAKDGSLAKAKAALAQGGAGSSAGAAAGASASTGPASNPARDRSYAELSKALTDHLVARRNEGLAVGKRLAEGREGMSQAELKKLEGTLKPIRDEVMQLKQALQALESYHVHPSQPPCPSWTWRVTTELVERTDDTVPPGALALTVTKALHLRDGKGKPEKGDITVSIRLPVPPESPATACTPSKRLDGEGSAEVGYSATIAIGPTAGARGGPNKTLLRAFERKHVTVEVERTSGGVMGLFASKAIIARGALPLTALVQETGLTTTIPLRPPEAEVSEDGVKIGGRAVATVPGAEGERGGLVVSLRVHAPVCGTPSKAVEKRAPVVTAWPQLVEVQAAQVPSNVGAGAAAAVPHVASAPAAVPAQATGAAASAPSPSPSPAPAAASTVVHGIDITSRSFRPDDPSFLFASSNLLTEGMEEASASLAQANGAYIKAKAQAQAQAAAIADEAARQDMLDSALLPLAAKVKGMKGRYDALKAGLDELQARAGRGELTQDSYTAQVEAAVARDTALVGALKTAGRAQDAAIVTARLDKLQAELTALKALPPA